MSIIKRKTIAVVGDLMLDQYYFGQVNRISPEAPVPVFLKKSTSCVPGGAANVAMNLLAAEQDVMIFSVLGADVAGKKIKDILSESGCNCGGIVETEKRCTSVKTRLVAQSNQQMLRIDEEVIENIEEHEEKEIFNRLHEKISCIDAIIVSDYMKGVLTEALCKAIIDLAKENNITVLADVKDSNAKKYYGVTVLKPNRNELAMLTGMRVNTKEEILNAANELKEMCGVQYVVATLGSKGMVIVGHNDPYWIPCVNHEVYDVSGAGDTVISYLAASISNGLNIIESSQIANCAAGVKVTKMGTAPVKLHEIEELQKIETNIYASTSKIVTLEKLQMILKDTNKKIVFTNGCFDILHFGHVSYLRKAATYGDVLVVGLNSDASVKRLKGDKRPVNCENDRAEILSALEFVDYVIIFDEDTPSGLIETLLPDVLVKGADYKKADVVGADIVEKNGGRVELIEFVENHSTTSIIQKLGRD